MALTPSERPNTVKPCAEQSYNVALRLLIQQCLAPHVVPCRPLSECYFE